ncbi:MAG TPA: type II and III secretion system protein [Cytophagaceae bacterium]|nr:type II and III secretion system protein [Cytophagaceae bacterium]
MKLKYFLLFVIFLLSVRTSFAQKDDHRFVIIEESLKDLSSKVKGLNETVDYTVTGVSIQEFMRGLAETHNLNIAVDPSLNIKIYNNFSNEKVINVLMFLITEYDLDVRFVGTIMSFYKYAAPDKPIVIAQREIIVRYNNYNNLLTLDLKNDTLDRVARKITQQSKKNVVISPALANKIVSVYIEDMPFDGAMQKFAFANNLKVAKTDDNSYLLQTLAEGEESEILVNKNKKRNTLPKNPSQPGAGGQVLTFLEVTKDSTGNELISFEAVNIPIDQAIKQVAAETGVSYFMFSEIKGTISTKVDKVNFDQFLSYILKGTDYTYREEKSLFLIGDRKLEGLRANRVFQFQFRSYSDIQDVIPAEIKKNVEIKEFKELNSILLTGSLPQIMEIEAFFKHLDKVVPMVLIDVIMLDVTKSRTISTGISAGLADSVKTGGSVLPGFNFNFSSKSINNFLDYLGTNTAINIGRVTPNFYIGLKALENNGNTEVRQMPKLSTLNSHEANLTIGSTRYYSIQSSNVIGTGITPTVSNAIQWIPVQANLTVAIKPVVSGDDQVTLTIDVHVTDFTDAPNNSAPPASQTSQFKSIIRVRNDEVIVLGGLERTEKSDQISGFPILSRIPILRWIFSSRTKAKNKRVSIIFIKPTIIY